MNYSESEVRHATDDELIDRALLLLPELVKLLHASLTCYQQTCGLSIGQVKAMLYLGEHGCSTVGEIAAGLGASMPSASEMVDRLVEDGLAERTPNPADRRQMRISLTPAAERMAADMHATRRRQVQLALERLAPAERPVFVRSLEALVDGLRQGIDAQVSGATGLTRDVPAAS